MTELAIYGGTFAPVHNGHIALALGYAALMKPDLMLVIPTLIPPHKRIDYSDDPAVRMEMLRLAFAGTRGIELCDYELTREGPSYTVLTLEHFTAPDTRITFLTGGDMFVTLDKWYRAGDIFRLARIAVARRTGENGGAEGEIAEKKAEYIRDYGADIIELPLPVVDISSTRLREAVKSGADISAFVPDGVNKYIRDNKLYLK